MKIAAILSGKGDFVATVSPDSTVAALLATLAQYRIGAVVVAADGGSMLGMASERDVARSLTERGAVVLDGPVSQIMSDIIATCSLDSSVEDVMVQMTEKRVRHIPVIEEEAMVGIVSIGDVVKARIDFLEEERKSLLNYITS
ncbi:MAG: CBS domain-containing protein [Actinobacteria bacterium]|nr:CBS domain-containing protein [Actinomycetota bacterium]